ncbi:leucine-rich repeat and calponin homology domain-containing protein-like isoform X1 [Schistocerca cancellata]|uniref:leucine-rich repeat and calponin homology domain-containing protein-like isoform X1 n=1 Tax=Schistocerca cancellata TaxID=274614 RepID=UPI0021174B06|nr:leucine-rich repeat and calponin homology domain-containing protein-like isoform X1 [Schistocerca cancellata]
MAMVASNMSGHLQSQLTRSLEKILEEAHLSGELRLTGRKLKDFPLVRGKYDLSDTVIAGKLMPVYVYDGELLSSVSMLHCRYQRKDRRSS